MRFIILTFVFFGLNIGFGFSYVGSAAIILFLWFAWELFEKASEQIAFKQFITAIYGLNYLLAPAITYLNGQNGLYRMKIPEDEYFSLAIPCMLLLQLGMNLIKTGIFHFNFKTVQIQSLLNRAVLLNWFFVGLLLRLINQWMPGDLAFFAYLLSGIRFVAAYGLFVLDARRYKWHIGLVFAVELVLALQQGMFHDLLMWVIFFGLFWFYLARPTAKVKIFICVSAILLIYVIQVVKGDYRSQTQEGSDAGLTTFQSAVEKKVNEQEGLFNNSNTNNSLTRVNQAWIFASTVDRMNAKQDFQGMDLMKRYAEAAILPRFFAPNKLKSGDKEIFNRFSGHYIQSSTSMGLGFLADGYIAFGQIGSYVFAFLLGLVFSVIFKAVESWAKISPFFVLLIFPILNYAVRPDCETQTIMGHIFKGLLVFGGLMWYYSVYFTRKMQEVIQDEKMASIWKSKMAKRQAKLN